MLKFTDRQLVELYSGLREDYKAYQNQGMPPRDIETLIYSKLEQTLNPSDTYFSGENVSGIAALNENEKNKVRSAADAIIKALKTATAHNLSSENASEESPRTNSSSGYSTAHHYACHHSCCRHYYNDRPHLYTWLYIHRYESSHHSASYGIHRGYGSNVRQAPSNVNQSKAELAYLLIGAAAIFAAALAAYYLYFEIINSADRFFYHEGWTQAACSYLSIAASAAISGILSGLYASMPLFELSLMAGFANPLFATGIVLVALTIIGTALGCMAFNALQDYVVKSASSDALDPNDPARFALTESDIEKWPSSRKEMIDPVKVKCGIVALRATLGENTPVSTINGLFSSKETLKKKKEVLEEVRKLRSGERDTLTVDGLTFDFRIPSFSYDEGLEGTDDIPYAYATPVPSAPPLSETIKM